MVIEKVERYGELNTHDIYKLIALISMAIGLIAHYAFAQETSFARILGQIAAPILFFIAGTARYHYSTWLLVASGLVLSYMAYTDGETQPINILLNFVLLKTFLAYLGDKIVRKVFLTFIFLCIALLFYPLQPYIEYGPFALLFGLSGFLYRRGDSRRTLFLFFTIIYYLYLQTVSFALMSNFLLLGVFCAEMFFAFYLLNGYQLLNIECASRPLGYGLKLLARMSLEIYLLFLIVLKVIFTV